MEEVIFPTAVRVCACVYVRVCISRSVMSDFFRLHGP